MDNAVEGIHILDEKGYVLEANKAFCQSLGYTQEEALRLKVADWEAKISADEIEDSLQQLFNKPTVFETLHKRKDGTIFDAEISMVGNRNTTGSLSNDVHKNDLCGEKKEKKGKKKM